MCEIYGVGGPEEGEYSGIYVLEKGRWRNTTKPESTETSKPQRLISLREHAERCGVQGLVDCPDF